MIKLCIFDLDGTILDTLGQIDYYVNYAMKLHSLPAVPYEKVREFVGNGARNLIKRSLDYVGKNVDYDDGFFVDFFDKYIEIYNSDVNYLVSPYEGIKEALDFIKSSGIKIAVMSNKPHSTVVPCVKHFFGDVFDIVSGAKDGVPLKPDPTSTLALCEAMGALPEETVFFGDSEVDMYTAKNYGAKIAAGALWGFRDEETLRAAGSDVNLKNPSQIIDLIRSVI